MNELLATYRGYVKASGDAAANGNVEQAAYFHAMAQEVARQIETAR